MKLPIKRIKSLKIEKIIYKGYGLGWHENFTILVEHTVPGDLVDIEITSAKKNILFAKVIKYLSRSPLITEDRCSVSGLCGGCMWVNINAQSQNDLKNQILNDLYKPLSDRCLIHSVIPSPVQDHYRNKIYQPVQLINQQPVSGIYARNTHEVISHQSCFLHPPLFDQIIGTIIEYCKIAKVNIYDEKKHQGSLKHIGIRQSVENGSITVILVTKSRKLPFTKTLVHSLTNQYPQITGIIQNIQPDFTNVILGTEDKILFGSRELVQTIGDRRFIIDYQAFFQVNLAQTKQIYDKIKELCSQSTQIIDAYSGAGTIGLYIADKDHSVICIEENPYAHLNSKKNAELNNIENAVFYCSKTEELLPMLIQCKKIDTIIFDPPRKGLDPSIIYKLGELNIPKIIYMSCNPSTQVRDLLLLEKNGYKTEEVFAYDMFPHTWHIETLAVLKKY